MHDATALYYVAASMQTNLTPLRCARPAPLPPFTQYTPSLVSKPLSSFKCIHVACGGQHTICVTDTDDVYGFGSDRHGQLGLGKHSIVVPVPSR